MMLISPALSAVVVGSARPASALQLRGAVHAEPPCEPSPPPHSHCPRCCFWLLLGAAPLILRLLTPAAGPPPAASPSGRTCASSPSDADVPLPCPCGAACSLAGAAGPPAAGAGSAAGSALRCRSRCLWQATVCLPADAGVEEGWG